MTHDIRLGYLGFEVRSLAAWEPFAVDVLGLQVGTRGEGTLDLRCDERAKRFFLTEGPADDVAVFGWEVDDGPSLDAVAAHLRTAGVDVTEGTDEEARGRGVTRLVKLRDPSGHPLEIAHGAERAATPFVSKQVVSSFVTGAQGLGHVVISASDPARSMAFYRDLLGFRLSDRIACDIFGYAVDITFFHGGPRHHSVAIGGPQKKRVHHFMLEVASMDDVGLAFDRALRGGVRITQTLGRHPNDRMFSFYARTPSGFHFEYGWGGRTVDDATWKPTTYDHISEWGHQAPEQLAPRPRERSPEPSTTEKMNEHTTGSRGAVRRDR
jgi:2,3-dihydroxybiphenyl 1,2-dioxygenase